MRRSLAALALAVVLPGGALLSPAARADVVVKPGETLSEIADRHGVSLNRLMQANGISNPNMVVAGTRLVIPGSRTTTASGRSGGSGGSVTVRQGETLSEIADRNGISLNRLMQANGISNPDMVVAGTRLVIPGSRAAAAPAPALRAGGATVVRNGETLSEIADRNGTTVERLMQLNGITNPNMVVAGTRLALPGRPRSTTASAARPAANARHHVVQPGETLSHIADDYKVPVDRLISLNQIDDPDLVVAGTRLKLQAPPPVARPKPRAVAATPKPQPKPKPQASPQTVARNTAPAAPVVRTQPVAKAESVAQARPVAKAEPAAKAEPVAKAQTAVKAEPVAKAEPAVKAEPTPRAAVVAKAEPVVQAEPVTRTAPRVEPAAKAEPAANAAVVANARPTRTAATRTATANATATARKPVGPDWRTYGPMQVDWANWRAMGGSFVAPSLGSDGKPHYLAVNCGARKLNATSQSGQWKTWDSPQNDFEQQLVTDICTNKGA